MSLGRENYLMVFTIWYSVPFDDNNDYSYNMYCALTFWLNYFDIFFNSNSLSTSYPSGFIISNL